VSSDTEAGHTSDEPETEQVADVAPAMDVDAGEVAEPVEPIDLDAVSESPEAAESAAEALEPGASVEESAGPGTEEDIDDSADDSADIAEDGIEVDSLPDVTSDEALEAALESLLLVVDSPTSEEVLADTVAQPTARVTVALRTMSLRFTERSSGIDLRRVGEGWRFYTRDTYAPFVEKLLLDGQRSKLTRAALESLAVIAYRQPVTRARVSAVRGVNVDGVIRTLVVRGLIEENGTDSETGGILYVTTELFLERLGLSSLTDLPAIAPLLPEVDTIDDI
jgi:segregation and condensation protein B